MHRTRQINQCPGNTSQLSVAPEPICQFRRLLSLRPWCRGRAFKNVTLSRISSLGLYEEEINGVAGSSVARHPSVHWQAGAAAADDVLNGHFPFFYLLEDGGCAASLFESRFPSASQVGSRLKKHAVL